MSNTLFRKTSLEHVSSPEQLNDYIRVTNPGVWLVLGAVTVLLVAVLVWGFLGALPTTLSAQGLSVNGEVAVFLSQEDAADLKPGAKATIDGAQASVYAIADVPLSREEVIALSQSDYIAYKLNPGEWNVRVTLRADAPISDEALHEVSIVASSVRPIDFLLN